jgi:hypothetical protein
MKIQSEKSMVRRARESKMKRRPHGGVARRIVAGAALMSGPMPPSAPASRARLSPSANGALHLVKGSVEMRITGSPVPRAVMRRGRGARAGRSSRPSSGSCTPTVPARRTANRLGRKRSVRATSSSSISSPIRPRGVTDARNLTPAQRAEAGFRFQFRFSLPKPVARVLRTLPHPPVAAPRDVADPRSRGARTGGGESRPSPSPSPRNSEGDRER